MPTTYCTESDITNRKGESNIAKITGDASGQTVDSAKVSSAIEEFADKMNAAIRKHYPELPFDGTSALLNGLNLEGAYLLLVRDSDRGWTENDRKDWQLLMDEIRDIAKGITDLRTETEEEADAMTEGFFNTNKAVFGRGKGL